MSEYQPLQVPEVNSSHKSAESKYWRSFKNPILINQLSAINSVSTSKGGFAISTNARLILYTNANNSIKKTISRFKDTALCADYRQDGKIIVAGDASGTIQLFDIDSRSILRTLRGHKGPVRAVKFANNTTIWSVSDDKTVKVWDIPTETCVRTFSGHTDYVRDGSVSPVNENLFVSASYDHTIKVWDARTSEDAEMDTTTQDDGENGQVEKTPNSSVNGCTMTLNHGAPVESIMVTSKGLLISSGGNSIKIWDGFQCLHVFSNSQKTVTSLCLDSTGSRLLSGSLDGHLRVYNMEDFKLVHSVKYPAPILSVGLSSDVKLVVGMSTGLVSIRHRSIKTADHISENNRKQQLRGGTYRFFIRGSAHRPDQADVWVESKKVKVLKKYDRLLKKFQYSTALDAVLHKNQSSNVVISLLRELIHRDALRQALANRDDISLEPIATFIKKHIANPRFTPLLIDVTNVILDMYSFVINQSSLIDELFAAIKTKVNREIALHDQIQELVGMMDCMINLSIRV